MMMQRKVLVVLILSSVVFSVSAADAQRTLKQENPIGEELRRCVQEFNVDNNATNLWNSLVGSALVRGYINDPIDAIVVERLAASGTHVQTVGDRSLACSKTLLDLAYSLQEECLLKDKAVIAQVIATLKEFGAKTAYRLSWEEMLKSIFCCTRRNRVA